MRKFDQLATGIACLNSQLDMLNFLEYWINDTDASDHMTPVHNSIFGYLSNKTTK